MAIVVLCPRCDRRYALADTLAGRRVKCKDCTQEFPIPHQSSPAAVSAQRATRPAPSAPRAPSWMDDDQDDDGPIGLAPPPRRPVSALPPRELAAPAPVVKKKKKRKAKDPHRTSLIDDIGGFRVVLWAIKGVVALMVLIFGGRAGWSQFGGEAETQRSRDAVALLREYAGALDGVSMHLETINDRASAQMNAPFLNMAQQHHDQVWAKVRAFGILSKGEDNYVKAKVGWTMRESMTRFKYAVKKLESLPGFHGSPLWTGAMEKDLQTWGGPTR